ncbi:CAP domain-containing protein [Paenibacillus sp. MBLB4367]|uniref:CAP domain-containing protein n=1 Tax=Paenibacillus sp. MBLB4367 TaxID=3384767 RepID=UPI0039082404
MAEPEFLAMLLRAYPDIQPGATGAGEPWYAPYYRVAGEKRWAVRQVTSPDQFNRGNVAQLITTTQGKQDSVDGSIRFLLAQGLASGKTDDTVDGFGQNDRLTRAEAVQFIKNMKDKGTTVTDGPAGAPAAAAAFTVGGLQLGQTEASVIAKRGQPARKDASEYGFRWYIYNGDYKDYVQVGIQAGKVVALFSNADNWSSSSGVKIGTKAADAEAIYGKSIRVVKGNTIDSHDKNEIAVYKTDGSYVTLFFDKHKDNTAAAVQLVDQAVEDSQQTYYPAYSKELRSSFEKQSLDLANASRARFGLAPFAWDDKAADTARKHSKDMAERNYFDHTNLDGESPFDRMKANGIIYRQAAENIAAGQRNAIYAHAGWMNSLGHRNNLLSDIARLGVGVHFGGDMSLYYTQNFYTPMR